MRRLTVLAGLLALAGGCGRAAPHVSDRFGVNAQAVFDAPSATRSRQLDAMRHAGIRLVRADAAWDAAEPAPPQDGRHSYRWEAADRIVLELARRKIRWLPTLAYPAPWAAAIAGQRLSPPARPSDYAAYAQAFVARYGGGGEFWRAHPKLPRLPVRDVELWNEPNWPTFWPPGPQPARYADVYLTARAAMRATGRPVRAIVGGLASPAADFLREMYAARPDLRGNVDGVGLHPYAPTAEGALGVIAGVRRALEGFGERGVPILVTEQGWPTQGRAGYVVSQQRRADFLGELVRRLAHSDCRVRAFVAYAWTTPERDPADDQDWYGLYDGAARPNPSGRAFVAAVRDLNETRVLKRPGTKRICGEFHT